MTLIQEIERTEKIQNEIKIAKDNINDEIYAGGV